MLASIRSMAMGMMRMYMYMGNFNRAVKCLL